MDAEGGSHESPNEAVSSEVLDTTSPNPSACDDDPNQGVTILAYKRGTQRENEQVIDVESYVPALIDLNRDTSEDAPIDIDDLEPAVICGPWSTRGTAGSYYSEPSNQRSYTLFNETDGAVCYHVGRWNGVTVDVDDSTAAQDFENTDSCLRCPICMSSPQMTDFASSDESEPVDGDPVDLTQSGQPELNWCATRCGHIFCRRCITSSIRRKPICPVCRTSIRGKSDLINLYI